MTAQALQALFADSSIAHLHEYPQWVFGQLHRCHTAAMGMHHYRCNSATCGHRHIQYHSCGNRHCPNCGGMKRAQWIDNLKVQLLPTAYYHVVFTLPHEFHALILGNRVKLYKLLFDAASQTLLQLSQHPDYLGATCGITMVLHTWGQDLSFHPHVHCIVSGGGIKAGKWIAAKRANSKFLFPVKAMQTMYKGIYLSGLRKLLAAGCLKTTGINTGQLIKKAGYKKWNVYAKSPFSHAGTVVEYLGRYTHKIAITRHRILSITDTSVTFKYKDYAVGAVQKTMTLSRAEFLRRLALHFLPRGFVKIRHYGYMQNHGKAERLRSIRKQLHLGPLPPQVIVPAAQRLLEQTGTDITQCPQCKTGKMELLYIEYPKSDCAKLLVRSCIDQQASAQGQMPARASPAPLS
ncbi:MAG: IS91 family transposase [Bacteroidetes bacterium]|nr:MAG: IS91 family transposase [Bacteroidota bacterium]